MLPGPVGVIVILLWLEVSAAMGAVVRKDTSSCVIAFPLIVSALIDVVGESGPLGWGRALAATTAFGSVLPGILRHYHCYLS